MRLRDASHIAMVLIARALSLSVLTAVLAFPAFAGSVRRGAPASSRNASSLAHVPVRSRQHAAAARKSAASKSAAHSHGAHATIMHYGRHAQVHLATERQTRAKAHQQTASARSSRKLGHREESSARQVSVVRVIRPAALRPALAPITEQIEQPLVLPTVVDTHGRLVMPSPLRGSREILLRQNQLASDDGLGRIQDDADLEGMRRHRMLIDIPDTAALHVDDRLPENRRVCRPWTAQFLADLSRAHYARFHTPLQLTSAVRTVAFQQHLLHINGNAAPADGETASPHLTGQAIDLAKKGLSLTEIAWLRGYLLPLIEAGKVDVEEEFRQACFHISVYRRYGATPDALPAEHYTVAARAMTPTLAATMP